jgi:zinc protease
MDVLLTMLGQGPGNRLDTQLHRKRHLVDTVSADFLTQRDPGLLTVTATFTTGNLGIAEAAILDQVKLLRDNRVSDQDLTAAKMALQSSYLFDVQTDSGHADALGFYDMIDSYQYDVDYLTHVMAVTPEDLQRVARTYLNIDAYTDVSLVPPTDSMNARQTGSAHLASANN